MSDILIDVRANLSQYNADLRKVEQDTQKSVNKINSILKGLKGMSPLGISQGAPTQAAVASTEKLTASIKKQAAAQRQLTAASARTARQQAKAEKGTQQLGQTIGQTIKKMAQWALGWTLMFRALRIFTDGLKDGIKIIIDYETEMVKLRRVLNDTEEGLRMLGTANLELAQKFGVGIKEVINISVEWAKQGKTALEIQQLTEATLLATRAAFLEEENAVKFLSATLNAFNMDASRAVEIVDLLNNVSRRFAISSDDLGNALQRSSFSARAAGVSLEELTGLVTAVSEATRRSGENIGTAFRTIFTKFKRPKAIDALEEAGVKVLDAQNNFRPFIEILAELSTKWDKLSGAQKFNVQQQLAGVRRSNEFLAIMEKFPRVFDVMDESTRSAGSAVQEVGLISETVQFKIDQLKVSWEKFWASFGEADASPVKTAIKDVLSGLEQVLIVGNKIVEVFNKATEIKDKLTKIPVVGGAVSKVVSPTSFGATGPAFSAAKLAGSGIQQAKELTAAIKGSAKVQQLLNVVVKQGITPTNELIAARRKLVQDATVSVQKKREEVAAIEKGISLLKIAGEGNDELRGKVERQLQTSTAVQSALEKEPDLMKAAEKARDDLNSSIEDTINLENDLATARLQGRRSDLIKTVDVKTTQRDIVGDQINALKATGEVSDQAGSALDSLTDAWRNFTDEIKAAQSALVSVNEALGENVAVSEEASGGQDAFSTAIADGNDIYSDAIVKIRNMEIASGVLSKRLRKLVDPSSVAQSAIANLGIAIAVAKQAMAVDPTPENLADLQGLEAKLREIEGKAGKISSRGGGGGRAAPPVTGQAFIEQQKEKARLALQARQREVEAKDLPEELKLAELEKARLEEGAKLFKALAKAEGKKVTRGRGRKKKEFTILTEEQFESARQQLFDLGQIGDFPSLAQDILVDLPKGKKRLDDMINARAAFFKQVESQDEQFMSAAKRREAELIEVLFLDDEDRIAASRTRVLAELDAQGKELLAKQKELRKSLGIQVVAGEEFLADPTASLVAAKKVELAAAVQELGAFQGSQTALDMQTAAANSSDLFNEAEETFFDLQTRVSGLRNELQLLASLPTTQEGKLISLGELSEEKLKKLIPNEEKRNELLAISNKLLEVQESKGAIILEQQREQVQAVADQIEEWRQLQESIQQDFQAPLMDFLTDYETQWDETLNSIGKKLQGRQLENAFESVFDLSEKFLGGGLSGILATGLTPVQEQPIINAHMKGGEFVKQAIIDGHVQGAAATTGVPTQGIGAGVTQGAITGGGLAPGIGAGVPGAFIFSKLARLGGFRKPNLGALSGLGGLLGGKPEGDVGVGELAKTRNKILDKLNSPLFSQGLATALGFGLSAAQGGDIGMAFQNALPGIGGLIGTAAGGPLGGQIGQAGGLLASLLTRDLFGGGEGKETRRTETRRDTDIVSSRLDLTNRELSIANRNLSAIKESLDPFARPESFFFRERIGFGVQQQTVDIIIKDANGGDIDTIQVAQTVEGALRVQRMREQQ